MQWQGPTSGRNDGTDLWKSNLSGSLAKLIHFTNYVSLRNGYEISGIGFMCVKNYP